MSVIFLPSILPFQIKETLVVCLQTQQRHSISLSSSVVIQLSKQLRIGIHIYEKTFLITIQIIYFSRDLKRLCNRKFRFLLIDTTTLKLPPSPPLISDYIPGSWQDKQTGILSSNRLAILFAESVESFQTHWSTDWNVLWFRVILCPPWIRSSDSATISIPS